MPVDLLSLAIIALVAAACPIVARSIPRKLIPETVFLLIAGALLGPHLFGAIELTDSVNLLSDLGLAFLFLLAGYEINPKNLTGRQGRRGLVTWIVCIALAFLAVRFFSNFSISHMDGLAMAIALTTTALGTLMPIMKERKLMGTQLGDSILAYGTWGELCPVLAMVLLLSTRAEWKTVLILLLFVAIAVVVAVLPGKTKKIGSELYEFLTENANTTSQTIMRITVLLLIGLVALSAAFNLDIVLGAFAAGFVLRHVIPDGDHILEHKLEGVAYGFLIPIFFVVSGAKIDLTAVFQQPALLIGFIVMLLFIRTVPIFVALSTGKDTREMSSHNRVTIALYCTTALPIIVAVTSVAVNSGAMGQETASVLVAAGAITVFLMPFLASITYRVADAKPIEAVYEITRNPRDIGAILRDHVMLERMIARQESVERIALRHRIRAAEALSRHSSSDAGPSETWLPMSSTKQAIDVLNASEFDEVAWEQAKREGDAAWNRAKSLGDERWEQMKAAAEGRWTALKQAGDELAAMPWQDRAAALQEHAEHRRKIIDALDAIEQEIAVNSPDLVENAAREISARGVALLEKLEDAAHHAAEGGARYLDSVAAELEPASKSSGTASEEPNDSPAAAAAPASDASPSIADDETLSKKERRARYREERRQRIAQRAAREQQRRLMELTRKAERLGVSSEEASRIFTDPNDPKAK